MSRQSHRYIKRNADVSFQTGDTDPGTVIQPQLHFRLGSDGCRWMAGSEGGGGPIRGGDQLGLCFTWQVAGPAAFCVLLSAKPLLAVAM